MAEFINVMWALFIVLSVIGALAYFAKRSGYLPGSSLLPGKQPRLSIIESRALDARHRLVIASKDDKEYLLALGPGVITLLDSQEKIENFKDMISEKDSSGDGNE